MPVAAFVPARPSDGPGDKSHTAIGDYWRLHRLQLSHQWDPAGLGQYLQGYFTEDVSVLNLYSGQDTPYDHEDVSPI